jgi:zinc transporter
LRSTEALRQALHDGKTLSAPAALLESLLEHMAGEIEAAKNGLSEGMDKVEDSVLADALRDERTTLGHLRRRTARLHRRLTALHTLFQRIDPRSAAALSSTLHVAADRIAQRLAALDHDIHDLQQRGRQLQDEITAKLATVTNRHLHALSILTAVLLPPTLVTGIFGMNAKDLPLTDVDHGYLWALGICVISAGLTYLLLRKAPGLLKRGGIVD